MHMSKQCEIITVDGIPQSSKMPGTISKNKVKLVAPQQFEGHKGHSTKKGPMVKPKLTKSKSSSTTNSGDEKHCELDVPIQEKYRILQRLGKGAYGIVWEAVELKPEGKKVALKKIFDAFRNNTDAQRTYREIFFLLKFGHHPNIINLTNGHQAQNDLDFYLCFPLMSTDLHKLVKTAPEKIGTETMRSILYQISKAILYLHSADVIHRDIKPANILLDENMGVKLGDFGLARSLRAIDCGGDGHPEMTDYVATRWYRPPEILLNSKIYSKSVDIWALACILAEMAKKQALFAASNTVEQIELVLGTIEKASRSELEQVTSESMRSVAQAAMKCRKQPIREILSGQEPEVVDFIEKILIFDPKKRPTIEEVIAHPVLRWDRCVSEEIRSDHTVTTPIDDNVCFSLSKYRNLLYEMLKNGELLCPNQAFRETTPSGGFKQEKIRMKRNNFSIRALRSSEIGAAEKGGGGDAWMPPRKPVDPASFHSFPEPDEPFWPKSDPFTNVGPVDKGSELKSLRKHTESQSPSRTEVKSSKRKRAKNVPREKSRIPITYKDNIKGTDDFRGYSRASDPKIILMERLGTAPPNLQVKGGEFFNSNQFRPVSRNRDGYVSISLPTAADASIAATANKSKFPRPIEFKTKLREAGRQLESMQLGFRGLDSDIEKGGGDMRSYNTRRPSTTLPLTRSATALPRIKRDILPSMRDYSNNVPLRQFQYPQQQPQSEYWSSVGNQETFHQSDSLFITPEPEPETSLSFVDERPVSRSSIRNIEINRNLGETRSSYNRTENTYQDVRENWTDDQPGFSNLPRKYSTQVTSFEKPIENRKKAPAKYRDKLKHSSYFPGAEPKDSRRTGTLDMDCRDIFDGGSVVPFTRETQRSRIAAKMNNLPKNICTTAPPEPSRTRKKRSPSTYSSNPPSRPSQQMGRLTTVIEPRVSPFENYTKGYATISSKDLADLKATCSRKGRY